MYILNNGLLVKSEIRYGTMTYSNTYLMLQFYAEVSGTRNKFRSTGK